MDTAPTCPNASDLSDLVDGNLSDPELSDLASHLENCVACQQTVKLLSSHGTLADALRGDATIVEMLSDQTPREMVERIKLIPRLDTGHSEIVSADGAHGNSARQPFHSFKNPTPGTMGSLGRYRVLKLLGSGGMGSVFLAEDSKLNRHVALKVMLPKIAADPTAKERFLREARAAASLKSDHIVTVYQVDEEDEAPYLAMELLEGQSLDDAIRSNNNRDIQEIIHIVASVAKGLADAHEKGLIHRDIKPGNIWLESATDGLPRVKILDFGLARLEIDDTHLTHAHAIVGTPAFMAPEQARGEQGVDARSDLFSLGCVLYFLCVGEVPFKASSTLATLMALAVNTPEPPSNKNALVPLELSQLTMQLLEKDPSNRPQSAREVIAVLKRIKLELENGTAKFASSDEAEIREHSNSTARPRSVRKAGVLACVLIAFALTCLYVWGLSSKLITKERVVAADPQSRSSGTSLIQRATEQFAKLFDDFRATNPKFDGTLKPGFENGEITDLLISGKNVQDLDALQGLKHLRRLTLEGDGTNSVFVDLTPLHELSLRELRLHRNYVTKDLNPLKGMRLELLHADYSPISDLGPLQGMPLQDLQIWNWTGSDLAPLKGMPLNWVNIGGNNKYMDLSPLSGAPLVFLCVNVSHVSDMSPLKGMPLKKLLCNQTDISDLTPLKDARIEEIMLRGSLVHDISVLKNWPLKWIEWEVGFTTGLDILKGIPTLERINDQSAADYFKEHRQSD